MKALIFDTETTALITNSLLDDRFQPRVIEFFGHVVDDKGNVSEEMEFRCNPAVPIPKEVTAITGLSDKDVAGEKMFQHFIPGLRKLFSKAKAVVAHNLKYDYSVLNMELQRCGMGPLDWPKIKICTVQQTEWVRGCRLRLGDLHTELFGEPFAGAHRARADVEALTKCWVEMRARGWV